MLAPGAFFLFLTSALAWKALLRDLHVAGPLWPWRCELQPQAWGGLCPMQPFLKSCVFLSISHYLITWVTDLSIGSR